MIDAACGLAYNFELRESREKVEGLLFMSGRQDYTGMYEGGERSKIDREFTAIHAHPKPIEASGRPFLPP
jgi:hypothetical protein